MSPSPRSQGTGAPPIIDEYNRQQREAQENKFSVEKALNTKGFPEFLAKFPDLQEEVPQQPNQPAGQDPQFQAASGQAFENFLSDPGLVETRFNAFMKVQEVTGKIETIYKNELEKDLGIKFSAADLECVDEFLQDEAVENPERIEEIAAQIEQYNETIVRIPALEKEFEQLAVSSGHNTKINELTSERADVMSVIDKSGFFSMLAIDLGAMMEFWTGEKGKNRKFFDLRERVGQNYGGLGGEDLAAALNQLDSEKQDLDDSLRQAKEQKTEQIEALKAKFKDIRTNLFAIEGLSHNLTEAIDQKIDSVMQRMLTSNDLKKNDEVSALFTKIDGLGTSETTGIEYLTMLDKEAVKGNINRKADEIVGNKIVAAIRSARLGTGAWDGMVKAMESFAGMEKIGTRGKEETREWVVGQIREVRDQVILPENTGDSRAKALLLTQLINKLSQPKP